jgi:hypothetical protein
MVKDLKKMWQGEDLQVHSCSCTWQNIYNMLT